MSAALQASGMFAAIAVGVLSADWEALTMLLPPLLVAVIIPVVVGDPAHRFRHRLWVPTPAAP